MAIRRRDVLRDRERGAGKFCDIQTKIRQAVGALKVLSESMQISHALCAWESLEKQRVGSRGAEGGSSPCVEQLEYDLLFG